jgi:hypothetical protein
MNRGYSVFSFIFGVYLFQLLSQNAAGYGKTWLGRDLEGRVKNAAFNLGPFKASAAFTLSNVGYDSNIFYYTASDHPVHDYTVTAGIAFNIYLPIKKKVILSIYELPQYVYYKETARERTWNNYFNGELHFVLNRVVLTLGKGYTTAREKWNTEIDIRPRQIEDSYLGSLLWQPSKRTSFGLSYRRAKFNYESADFQGFDIAARLNRVEDYFGLTGFYQAAYRTRLFLDAEYGHFDFADPLSLKDSESYAAHGGFEFSPLGKISGRVKVGFKYLNPLSVSRQDYKGLVGDSQVSARLMTPWKVRAYYRRDIQFSIWYDATYFLENVYGAGTSLYLFRNIRLDYDYYRGRNSYPESISIKRRDDYLIHSVGLYFRIKNNIAFGAIASHWERESNLSWENDNRNFVGFNLIYDF